MVILLLCGDRRLPIPSALYSVKSGPRKCRVASYFVGISFVFCIGKGQWTDYGTKALSRTSG